MKGNPRAISVGQRRRTEVRKKATPGKVFFFICLVCFGARGSAGPEAPGESFMIPELRRGSNGSSAYAETLVKGREFSSVAPGARREVPAIDLHKFWREETTWCTEPILEWLVWYESQALWGQQSPRALPEKVLQERFVEVERRLISLFNRHGFSRLAPEMGNECVINVALDDLCQEKSKGRFRLSPTQIYAPLKIADLTDSDRAARAMILLAHRVEGSPGKNKRVGYLAFALSGCDRAGAMTLLYQGKEYRVSLRNVGSRQFIYPPWSDDTFLEVSSVLVLRPFEPIDLPTRFAY